MKHIAIMLAMWFGSVIALGLIARVTYLVFMIGWGLV